MKIPVEEGIFDLGTFAVESGISLTNAIVAYKTHGRLNADKSNVILYPTQIGAQHNDIAPRQPAGGLVERTDLLLQQCLEPATYDHRPWQVDTRE